MNRALATVCVPAWAAVLAFAPVCAAEPPGPAPDPEPVNAQTAAAPLDLPGSQDSGNPISDACGIFNAALNVAAANYDDFAYATAGNGDYVNYQDPEVGRTNVIGRTALRQSAAAALSASRTPGLPPEVSDPMRTWSLRATKLLLVMGLHGGGDTLNNSVLELNTIANDAQMACATKGGRS